MTDDTEDGTSLDPRPPPRDDAEMQELARVDGGAPGGAEVVERTDTDEKELHLHVHYHGQP